jgi:hypothetical protein
MRVTMKSSQLKWLMKTPEDTQYVLIGQNGTLTIHTKTSSRAVVPVSISEDFAATIYPHTIEKLKQITSFAHPDQQIKMRFLDEAVQIKITL